MAALRTGLQHQRQSHGVVASSSRRSSVSHARRVVRLAAAADTTVAKVDPFATKVRSASASHLLFVGRSCQRPALCAALLRSTLFALLAACWGTHAARMHANGGACRRRCARTRGSTSSSSRSTARRWPTSSQVAAAALRSLESTCLQGRGGRTRQGTPTPTAHALAHAGVPVPDEPEFDDFVRISKEIMRGRTPTQQMEVVSRVLGSLLPPGAPEQFRCALPPTCSSSVRARKLAPHLASQRHRWAACARGWHAGVSSRPRSCRPSSTRGLPPWASAGSWGRWSCRPATSRCVRLACVRALKCLLSCLGQVGAGGAAVWTGPDGVVVPAVRVPRRWRRASSAGRRAS